DIDRVDVVPLQQLTKVGVNVGDSVVSGHTLGFSLVDVRHGDNLGSRNRGVLLDVTLTNDADADHSDADLVHFTLSPILSILTLFKKRVRREAPNSWSLPQLSRQENQVRRVSCHSQELADGL